MKAKLKQTNGFALVGVLMILAIASLFGMAMYGYCITSFRSIRFSTEDTKAEYLAQAGVEVGAYAYQTTFSEMEDDDSGKYGDFVADLSDLNGKADSTKVYLVWNKAAKKYEFISSDPTGDSGYVYVGYFTVKIETRELEFWNAYKTDPVTHKPTEKVKGQAKQIIATGHSGKKDKTYTSYGFFPDTVSASGKKYYTNDGFIQYPRGATAGNQSTYGSYTSVDVPFNVGIRRFFTTRIGQWLFGGDSNSFELDDINITPFGAASAGNMVLDKPKNSDTIKFYGSSKFLQEQNSYSPDSGNRFDFDGNYSNSVLFAGGKDIFVQANVDLTPGRRGLNAISFVGQNIVINGNIEMYVYCLSNTSNQTLIRSILNTAIGGYGMGKAIIGVPVIWNNETQAKEPQPAVIDEYGNTILEGASFMTAGKVYFGGNVTVTVEIANEGKHRYRVFNSGDVYYFDSSAKVMNYNNDEEGDFYGIDLLQYFLEDAVSNNRYGEKTLARFNTVLKFYYTNPNDTTHTNIYTGFKNGSKDVDVFYKIPKTDYHRYNELVPPTPFSTSTINWGQVPVPETTTSS